MKQIVLPHETDFIGWRLAARGLLAQGVAPHDAVWSVGAASDLFGEPPPSAQIDFTLTVPRGFITLATSVILHSDPARFALLYALLWRITRGEKHLLDIPTDPMVHRATMLAKSVRRDIHKMRAFLRFTEVGGDDKSRFYAWFEPDHYIVEANAGFFQRRFAAMNWFILTPYCSLQWDGTTLHKAGGAAKSMMPADDQMHDYWNTYFTNIFNPARLKVKAMTSEMPRKYWKNMPEATAHSRAYQRRGAAHPGDDCSHKGTFQSHTPLALKVNRSTIMKALVWHGRYDVKCDTVPDPVIEHDRDAIIKVTSTAICGSDLHLYDGYIPTMEKGDILGHEFMGEVVEVGKSNSKLKVGDRVVVPFTICCGECFFCKRGQWSCCAVSNPNAELAAKMYGHQTAGLFGYSHLTGGFAGGQAEYVRVPYADVSPFKIPDELTDEQTLFLTDIFPTGYMAAENANIQPGDTVAIWGAGPVGQFAIKSAYMFGAEKVIVIDTVPERLAMAKANNPDLVVIDFEKEDVHERLNEETKGQGPDSCIDCVGMEAHGHGSIDAVIDRTKAAVGIASDRIHVLRQAIFNVRSGGTVSVPVCLRWVCR